jgi:hypothetical protein
MKAVSKQERQVEGAEGRAEAGTQEPSSHVLHVPLLTHSASERPDGRDYPFEMATCEMPACLQPHRPVHSRLNHFLAEWMASWYSGNTKKGEAEEGEKLDEHATTWKNCISTTLVHTFTVALKSEQHLRTSRVSIPPEVF